MKATFAGGVRPEERKDLTCARAIETLAAPEKVVLPVSQHLGAPAEPVVDVGDQVVAGQPIAAARGDVSVPVHASISGRVTAIGPHPHPGGYDCLSITIEAPSSSSAQDVGGWVSPAVWRLHDPRPDYMSTTPDVLRALIRDAGMVGMGGAAFPTHVKLTPPRDKPVDTLIVNGAECEPYLTCDHRTMLEEVGAIVHGVRIMEHILGVSHVLIGIEENKSDAARKLEEAFARYSDWACGIDIVTCEVKYPQGSEKQLIAALTGRRVPPPPGLPIDTGVVVQNVSTAAAVSRAVMAGIPLIERVVTVSGSVVRHPGNLRVRLGTPLQVLVDACGGFSEAPAKILMGGPMMGVALSDLTVPVIKGSSGFVFLSSREAASDTPYACIRCGRCVEVCPAGLLPSELAARVGVDDLAGAQELSIGECLECGSCTYICPARRWLVQSIRLGKARLHGRKGRRVA